MTPQATAGAAQREIRARRWLAFSGVAPIGAFVAVHLVTTATALGGAQRFDRVFARSSALAFVTFVFVPFAFHSFYGAYLALAKPQSIDRERWWPRARLGAALVTFAFVVGHFVELPMKGYTGALRAESFYDVLAAHLSATAGGFPWIALAYLIGLAATLFHFATSTWTFVTSWSVVVTARGRRTTAWGLAIGAVLLFFVGARTIVFFATGSRLFGSPSALRPPPLPPPAPCRPKT